MLLDTWAWVHLFKDGPLADEIEDRLRTRPCATSILSLAELVAWATREGRKVEAHVERILTTVQVLPLDEDAAVLAGRLHTERRKVAPRFGMVDALILATALQADQTLLTGDPDFEGLSNVELLRPPT